MLQSRSFGKLSKITLIFGALASLAGVASAQPAVAPMGASATPTGRPRVWASTLLGDLATWEASSGWQVHVRGGVVGGVGAITYPGSSHREQAFYVREGRVRSLPLFNGAAGAEIVLPGHGSASFAGSAVAATRYGQIGIVVGAFTTTGAFCTWTGSTFGFTTAPNCVSGADRYSALVATTMSDSFLDGSFVSFFYRNGSGGLVRRMRQTTSTFEGAWGSTVLATNVSRPLAVLRDEFTGTVRLSYVQGGRVRVAATTPRNTHLSQVALLPATRGSVSDSSLGLAFGFGEGPGLDGLTRCTTTLSVTTSVGVESAVAFGSAPGPSCRYMPTLGSWSAWGAAPRMPTGATWGGGNLVLPGLWFGQATRTIGVGLRSTGGWLRLPYALLEVEGLNVTSNGSP